MHPLSTHHPEYCPAFTDHTHRYAYDGLMWGAQRWGCACRAVLLNAGDLPGVQTVNENTDMGALPFVPASGYDHEDYPMHLWPTPDVGPVPESQVPRRIPPHTHIWVEDGRYTDTGDWRERCVDPTCPATRSLTPAAQREEEAT